MTRGMLSVNPPPGDMGHRLDPDRLQDLEDGTGVDAGRLEQVAADLPPDLLFREHFAGQGESVAVEARGGQADDLVPRPDAPAVDDPVGVHEADAEARQVPFSRSVEAGELGRLAAEEGAARFAAALDDALHDLGQGRRRPAARPRYNRGRKGARRRGRRRRRPTWPRGRCPTVSYFLRASATRSLVPTPSVDETRTGFRMPLSRGAKRPLKPPIVPMTSGRAVDFTMGLIFAMNTVGLVDVHSGFPVGHGGHLSLLGGRFPVSK